MEVSKRYGRKGVSLAVGHRRPMTRVSIPLNCPPPALCRRWATEVHRSETSNSGNGGQLCLRSATPRKRRNLCECSTRRSCRRVTNMSSETIWGWSDLHTSEQRCQTQQEWHVLWPSRNMVQRLITISGCEWFSESWRGGIHAMAALMCLSIHLHLAKLCDGYWK